VIKLTDFKAKLYIKPVFVLDCVIMKLFALIINFNCFCSDLMIFCESSDLWKEACAWFG